MTSAWTTRVAIAIMTTVMVVSEPRAETAASIEYSVVERPAGVPADLTATGGSSLRFLAIKAGPLILEVDREPEFDTRVRDSDIDLLLGRQFNSPIETRMLVNVEDAPVFAERLTTPAFLLPEIILPAVGCPLHELQRTAVEVIDHHDDPIPVEPMPVLEVNRLGLLSLGEDQDRSTSSER